MLLVTDENMGLCLYMLITVTTILYWENHFFSFQQMSLKGSSSSNIEGLGPPIYKVSCKYWKSAAPVGHPVEWVHKTKKWNDVRQ